MTDITTKNEEATTASTDSISRLARGLDETRERAFIRREMWQLLLDIGWTNDPAPPPPR